MKYRSMIKFINLDEMKKMSCLFFNYSYNSCINWYFCCYLNAL